MPYRTKADARSVNTPCAGIPLRFRAADGRCLRERVSVEPARPITPSADFGKLTIAFFCSVCIIKLYRGEKGAAIGMNEQQTETLRLDLSQTGNAFKVLNAANGGPWHRRHAGDQYRSNLADDTAPRRQRRSTC